MREFRGWHHREQREFKHTRIQTSVRVQRSGAIDKRRQGNEALHVYTLDSLNKQFDDLAMECRKLCDFPCVSVTFSSFFFFFEKNHTNLAFASLPKSAEFATTIRSEITHEFRGIGHSSVSSQNACKKKKKKEKSMFTSLRSNFPPETFAHFKYRRNAACTTLCTKSICAWCSRPGN